MTKPTAILPHDPRERDADLDVPTRRSGTYSLPAGHLPICSAAGLSVRGRLRERNEDAWAARVDLGLFVVADGIGGEPLGEEAAWLAVSCLVDALADADPTWPRRLDDHGPAGRLWSAAAWANQVVYERGHRAPPAWGMAAGLSALLVAESVAHVVHAGDGAVFHLHEGVLRCCTEAHGRPGGVTRAFGTRVTLPADTAAFALERHDRLLLCSDGLWRMVARATLESIVRRAESPQMAVDELVAAATRAGAPDNVSAVVAFVR